MRTLPFARRAGAFMLDGKGRIL
ncbi:hypothetical protein IL54_1155 [Sphingobium sp. ba1]|nr:hypothetical protein IL54_1155 [Sphingobium sp. ba1]